MLISLEGENATGKTTLAYTAPLKIAGFAFDLGFERALFGAKAALFEGLKVEIVRYAPDAEPPPFEADITIFELPLPLQLDTIRLLGCTKLWNYFLVRYVAALQDEAVRTLVVDTATLARRIKADSYLEEMQKKEPTRVQLIQVEWGRPNDATRDLFTTVESMKKNLIALHHLTDERKDTVDGKGMIVQGMLTGNKILEGFNQTYRFVDVALRMKKLNGQITADWKKCGYNLAIEGTVIKDPTWDKLVDIIEMSTGGGLQLDRRQNDNTNEGLSLRSE